MEEITNYSKINEIYLSNGHFITRKNVNDASIPSWFLTDFVKRNGLVKLSPGFYASISFPTDEYFIFQNRYPRFVFSGMSALYLNGLTDKIPTEMEVSAPHGYHPLKEKNNLVVIKYFANKDIYELGIAEAKTMFGNIVSVYDRERTICDLIKRRDEYDPETFVKAIWKYRKSNNNQSKLFRYARLLKIEKKVFEIMELVSNEI